MGIKGVILEHQPHIAFVRWQLGDLLVTKEDPASADGQDAGDQVEQGTLAAATGAQQSCELPALEGNGEIVQGHCPGKLFPQVFKPYIHCHSQSFRP